MAQDAGLLLCEISGEHRYAHGGRLRAEDSFWAKTQAILSRMDLTVEDRSFAQFLQEAAHRAADREAAAWATAYIEGFNAADAQRVGTEWLIKSQQAAEAMGDDRQFWVVNGFGRLIEWLMEELAESSARVVFNARVHTMTWRKGNVLVEVTGHDIASKVQGRLVIVTVPLGVLQAKPNEIWTLRFDPEIPEYDGAARNLAMGSVVRMTLQCQNAFWAAPLPAAVERAHLTSVFCTQETSRSQRGGHPTRFRRQS